MTDGPDYAEAEWMSGWIALSFLEDPILATQHFHNFYENVGYPISLSRGADWLGKAYEKLNDNEIYLTEGENNLLLKLINKRNNVLSREELADEEFFFA